MQARGPDSKWRSAADEAAPAEQQQLDPSLASAIIAWLSLWLVQAGLRGAQFHVP